MPSEKALAEKKAIVESLSKKMSNSAAGVLVDYKGITVADDTKLRKELREAGVEYMVVKNTLLKFAAEANGYGEMSPHLNGTSAIAFSETDPVAAAKILTKYADASKGKFTVKAGFVDGGFIDAKKVAELGKLPSKEQLLAQLLSVLNGNLRGLACALNEIAEKKGGSAETVEAAEPTAE